MSEDINPAGYRPRPPSSIWDDAGGGSPASPGIGEIAAEAETVEAGDPAAASVREVINPETGNRDLTFHFDIPEGPEGPVGVAPMEGFASKFLFQGKDYTVEDDQVVFNVSLTDEQAIQIQRSGGFWIRIAANSTGSLTVPYATWIPVFGGSVDGKPGVYVQSVLIPIVWVNNYYHRLSGALIGGGSGGSGANRIGFTCKATLIDQSEGLYVSPSYTQLFWRV